jgi:multiple sugar transport system ATP-binding protein
MAGVQLSSLTKVYPDGTEAVRSVSFEIADGSLMVLVGPSGCGKTTILRMVAGLETITGGEIAIGDRVVNDVSPRDRDIAMVFQNYALYPHMTVRENMGFSLKMRRAGRDEVSRRVEEAAAILGLTEYLERRPAQLSGGQRQRVAMGRAIVREPQVFLMDEPLSNLDAKLRVQMRAEISRLQRRLGVTTLYVTHDQTEAMTMGDAVAVMRDGTVEQLDAPQALYDRPATLFVAAFIGSPAMNLAEGTLHFDGESARVLLGGVRLDIDGDLLKARPGLRAYDGRAVAVGIRPEDMEDAAIARSVPDGRRLTAQVELRESLGSEVLAYFGVDAKPITPGGVDESEMESPERSLFVARLNARTRASEGAPVELAVDTAALHFFDLMTGTSLA